MTDTSVHRRFNLTQAVKTAGIIVLLASQAAGRALQQSGPQLVPFTRRDNPLASRWSSVNVTAETLGLPKPEDVATLRGLQPSPQAVGTPPPLPNPNHKSFISTTVPATPLGGCSNGLYTVAGSVGGLKQHWMVDSGSSDLVVAGSNCFCSGALPRYTPGSTAQQLAPFQTAVYGSGQGSGPVFSDQVSLTQTPTVTLGLIDASSETDLFNTVTCGSNTILPTQGIVGIGPNALATSGTKSFIGAVQSATGSSVFATQLCSVGGLLWSTGYDPNALAGPIQRTPLSMAPFYMTSGVDMRLGNQPLNFAAAQPGPIIMDTGTNTIGLPTAAFDLLAATANPLVQSILGPDFFAGTGLCVEVSAAAAAKLDTVLPTLTVSFPDGHGNRFDLPMAPSRSYLTSVPSDNPGRQLVCSSVVRGLHQTRDGAWIYPNNLMQEHVLIWDIGNRQLGFAQQNRSLCPTSAQLPTLPGESTPPNTPLFPPNTPIFPWSAATSQHRPALLLTLATVGVAALI